MKFSEYKAMLSKRLEHYFTFLPDDSFNGKKYDIAAIFSSRQEQTVLFQENVIDFADSKEILLVSYEENLQSLEKDFTELPGTALNAARPSRNHKSTIITRIYVTTQSPEKPVIKTVKKFRYHKTFRFLLWGWTEVGIVLVNLADGKVYTNRTASLHKKIFTPENSR